MQAFKTGAGWNRKKAAASMRWYRRFRKWSPGKWWQMHSRQFASSSHIAVSKGLAIPPDAQPEIRRVTVAAWRW
jgi:hypothetical protein